MGSSNLCYLVRKDNIANMKTHLRISTSIVKFLIQCILRILTYFKR